MWAVAVWSVSSLKASWQTAIEVVRPPETAKAATAFRAGPFLARADMQVAFYARVRNNSSAGKPERQSGVETKTSRT